MRPSTTARRYAEAAYEVAREDNMTSVWLATLEQVANAIRRPEISAYFKEPNVPQEEKIRTAGEMAMDTAPHVRNLLQMLASLDRMHLVPSILQEMEEIDRRTKGVLEVSVTVARPMSPTEESDISQRLGRTLGKTVEIKTQVDPEILGGIIVRVGDRLVDASVRGRLDRLRSQLAT